MIHTQLSHAAKWSGSVLRGKDAEFTGIVIDSRQVTPGALFVALIGAHHDGHYYLDDAKSRGASCALVNHPVKTALPVLIAEDVVEALGRLAVVWRRSFQLPIIGVLGSNGKTTVKELTAAILRQQYGDAVLVTRGNQNNELGVPLNLLRLNSNYQAAVIEMGANSHGEIARLGNIAKPDIAVITNAGLDHIAGFGGAEGAARANGEIFATMGDKGIAVLNGDDEYMAIWRKLASKQTCLEFGFNPDVDVRGKWRPTLEGGELSIFSPWGNMTSHLPLMGRHNALNALAAATACLALGVELEAIVAGLASVYTVSGRLKPIISASGALIIDDTYNANPSSLKVALDTLSAMPGEKILLLGDMAELGDETENWHRWAGQAARSAGVSILFGLGQLAGFATESFGNQGYFFDESQLLLKALRPKIAVGSVILVKGSRCMLLENIVRQLIVI
jgi:UDP-N-acetylmuramoyl-tripeptide--D-alanyl-D-alanine ligase